MTARFLFAFFVLAGLVLLGLTVVLLGQLVAAGVCP